MNAKVIYLQDAKRFIKELPAKARRKVFINADAVSNGVRDTRLFKKLEGTNNGNSEPSIAATHIVYSHSGIHGQKR